MAAPKKTTYINTELDWAEQQLSSWKQYVDANPMHELKDRIEWKPTSKGGMLPMVIASIEVVDKLREKEESKIEIRGNGDLGSMAEDFLKGRR